MGRSLIGTFPEVAAVGISGEGDGMPADTGGSSGSGDPLPGQLEVAARPPAPPPELAIEDPAGDLEEQAPGRQRQLVRARPVGPSAEEREAHERSHEPYRSWCAACVAGRGRADSHVTRPGDEKSLPVVGVDYGYLWSKPNADGDEAEGDEAALEGATPSNPLLCGRNSRDGYIFGYLLPAKGDTEIGRRVLAQELVAGGYPRMIVRSDGEAAMVAHVAAAMKAASSSSGVELVREQTSLGDSRGNGLAEGAVKEVKGKIRTVRYAAEKGIGRVIPDSHDCLAWLVAHAADTINWERIGVDGKAPWERRFGRRFRRVVAPWGQKVLWMPHGKLASRAGAESRWMEGVFLGMFNKAHGAADYAVGTPAGVEVARAIKLKPLDEAWDPELLLAVKGLPWDRKRQDARQGSAGAAPVRLPSQPVPVDLPAAEEPAQPTHRRVYIRKQVELAKYGMTEGCHGCVAAATGSRAVPHNEECRRRIETAMGADAQGAARLGVARALLPGPADAAEGVAAPAVGDDTGMEGDPDVGGTATSSQIRGAEGAELEGQRGRVVRARRELESPPPSSAVARGARRTAAEADLSSGDEARGDPAIGQLLMELGCTIDAVDVAEVFSPGRFTSGAAYFKLMPGTAFDLLEGWDLSTAAGRAACWQALEEEKPTLVVGSPPCATFSTLRFLNKLPEERRQREMRKAIEHVNFCMAVYRWQIDNGRFFAHEHPWSASSWKLRSVVALRRHEAVRLVRCDHCVFGLTTWGKDSQGTRRELPARKRSGWLTNLPELAERLEAAQCDGKHEHAPMIGDGDSVSRTERYPDKLVQCILKALRDRLRADRGVSLNAIEVGIGPHVDDEPEKLLTKNDLGTLAAAATDGDQPVYWDAYTGMALQTDKVEAARRSELEFGEQLGAWVVRPREEAILRSGRAPIRTRWIDCNKGDDRREEYRSRLVVQETRRVSSIADDDIAAVSSATPPLEVVRLFCSMCMTHQGPGAEPLVMQFIDISRAHPHAEALRDNLYIEAPPELGLDRDQCLLLKKCWYGTRDAPQAFEFAVRDHFLSCDFEQGRYSTCVYKHRTRTLYYFVHGDDYVGIGSRADLAWFAERLKERFLIKVRGILGPASSDCRSIRILNRVLTWIPATGSAPDTITYEADQRHADLIRQHYGLSGASKGRSVCWDKAAFTTRHPLLGAELDPAEARRFRSVCMRLLFLSLDRPDLQFVAKEVSRAMAAPTVNANETVKSVGRYLIDAPRVVWQYPRQAMTSRLTALTDSSWGSCPVTRKSTSCVHLCLGSHPVYTGSSTQNIIALSSGESEFYGAVKAACRLLGMASLLADLHWPGVSAVLATDSSAAKGMASRRGAGRVRHIHCPALWLQQAVTAKRLTVEKRPGATLSPDVGTKTGIPAAKVWELLKTFNVVQKRGRSQEQLDTATQA